MSANVSAGWRWPQAIRARLATSELADVHVSDGCVVLDDGEVERRIRLVRPMERTSVGLAALGETHWRETDRETFARAWADEVAGIPAFTDSELLMVTGLLLPIWKRLPQEGARLYRLRTDAGERIIGREVPPAWAAAVLAADAPVLAPADAFAALLDGKLVLDLAEHLQLRRSRVMGLNRIELCGFDDKMRDRLIAYGLFSEIIAWKLRLFVPTDAGGVDVLGRVLSRYPFVRIADRGGER